MRHQSYHGGASGGGGDALRGRGWGRRGVKLCAILNDIQIPFQDPQVLGLVLRFLDDLKPYGIILNGDVVDCYAISDYDKDPLKKPGLQREVQGAAALMERFKYAKERIWLGGNHEIGRA